MNRDDRTIVNIHETAFDAYDLEGPAQEDMSLLSVSYNAETRRGIYVIRMEPGAVTIPHTHECMEEFLILEGELIESDGTVLRKGDACVAPTCLIVCVKMNHRNLVGPLKALSLLSACHRNPTRYLVQAGSSVSSTESRPPVPCIFGLVI